MRFSEAIKHLLNGEYIRRPEWRKDFYIKKVEDDAIVDCNGSAEVFYSKDIFANDLEIYQPKLDVCTELFNTMTVQSELCLVYLNQIRNTPF